MNPIAWLRAWLRTPTEPPQWRGRHGLPDWCGRYGRPCVWTHEGYISFYPHCRICGADYDPGCDR